MPLLSVTVSPIDMCVPSFAGLAHSQSDGKPHPTIPIAITAANKIVVIGSFLERAGVVEVVTEDTVVLLLHAIWRIGEALGRLLAVHKRFDVPSASGVATQEPAPYELPGMSKLNRSSYLFLSSNFKKLRVK